jgi:cadmium-exporting ATPase
MSRKQKVMLVRIIAGAVLFVAALFIPLSGVFKAVLFLVPYLVVGWDILYKAVRGIFHGQVFDENLLMGIATVGAFTIGEYSEGVAVMLFYQVGELFQSVATRRSRQSIASLMDIRPEHAAVEEGDTTKVVPPEAVEIGQVIVIKPGERVPLDGVVLSGESSLDTAALTGESLPRSVMEGDDVVSGCINLSGVLRVKVTKRYGQSTVAKILELVENSGAKKAKAENFITRFSRVYTPAVVLSALALAILPPLFVGGWSEWLHRALIFLVISCPCALVISVPLSFFGGIGGAARRGILVKGASYLEALSHAKVAVFDKTGTLTKGVFNVTAVHPDSVSAARLLELAAMAECYSDHPISKSLKEAYGKEIDPQKVTGVTEQAGGGVMAVIDGQKIAVGNDKLMESLGIKWHPCHRVGTTVHVAVEGEYAGHIVISDEIKPDAAEAIKALYARGVGRAVMLTGDNKNVAESVKAQLGLSEAYAQLLPGDKVEMVEKELAALPRGQKLLFVGDGINDAPVLSRADIGVAMGAMGSDAAIEAADIVLMDDRLMRLCEAVDISRKTLRIVRQNIVFALAVKALVLILGAFGVANMWEAVFADVGVSVIAILNAMRALRYKSK